MSWFYTFHSTTSLSTERVEFMTISMFYTVKTFSEPFQFILSSYLLSIPGFQFYVLQRPHPFQENFSW